MSEIYIFGAGGMARETADILKDLSREHDIAGFVESDSVYSPRVIHDLRVLPLSQVPHDAAFVVAIGDLRARKKIVETELANFRFETIIHPSVICAASASVGEGAIVSAGCILMSDVQLAPFAQLNIATTLSHDTVAGSYFTTAPGVNVCGEVMIGESVYLGAGCTIRDHIRIHSNITVGMGSVVVNDLDQEGVYYGNPATHRRQ